MDHDHTISPLSGPVGLTSTKKSYDNPFEGRYLESAPAAIASSLVMFKCMSNSIFPFGIFNKS